MSVGAAIRITSSDEERVIRHAVEFARQQGTPCYVISVVRTLPDDERARKNLELITQLRATPIIQEADEIPKTLLAVAHAFGVRTLFVQSGESHGLGRSIAEQLLYLDPPFDVVVVGSEADT
jgi:nucleotide-binding universal stress UspA family protein